MILEENNLEETLQKEAVDFAPGLEKAFAFVPLERCGPVTVEGDVPAFLRGTYYLNDLADVEAECEPEDDHEVPRDRRQRGDRELVVGVEDPDHDPRESEQDHNREQEP